MKIKSIKWLCMIISEVDSRKDGAKIVESKAINSMNALKDFLEVWRIYFADIAEATIILLLIALFKVRIVYSNLYLLGKKNRPPEEITPEEELHNFL